MNIRISPEAREHLVSKGVDALPDPPTIAPAAVPWPWPTP